MDFHLWNEVCLCSPENLLRVADMKNDTLQGIHTDILAWGGGGGVLCDIPPQKKGKEKLRVKAASPSQYMTRSGESDCRLYSCVRIIILYETLPSSYCQAGIVLVPSLHLGLHGWLGSAVFSLPKRPFSPPTPDDSKTGHGTN